MNGHSAAVLVALLDLQGEELPVVPVEAIAVAAGCDREATVAALHELQERDVVSLASFRYGQEARILSGWHAERRHAEALLRERDSTAVLGALLDIQGEEMPVVAIELVARTAGRDRATTAAALQELKRRGVVSISSFRYGRDSRVLTGWRAERPQAEALLREQRLASSLAPGTRLSALAQL